MEFLTPGITDSAGREQVGTVAYGLGMVERESSFERLTAPLRTGESLVDLDPSFDAVVYFRYAINGRIEKRG